jgi:hypothetical protein
VNKSLILNTNAQNINNDKESIVECPDHVWNTIKSFIPEPSFNLDADSFIIKDVVLKFDMTRTDFQHRQDWFIFTDDITKSKTFHELRARANYIINHPGGGDYRIGFRNIDDNSNLNLTTDELYKCDILFYKLPNISYFRGQKQITYIYKAELKYCKPLFKNTEAQNSNDDNDSNADNNVDMPLIINIENDLNINKRNNKVKKQDINIFQDETTYINDSEHSKS